MRHDASTIWVAETISIEQLSHFHTCLRLTPFEQTWTSIPYSFLCWLATVSLQIPYFLKSANTSHILFNHQWNHFLTVEWRISCPTTLQFLNQHVMFRKEKNIVVVRRGGYTDFVLSFLLAKSHLLFLWTLFTHWLVWLSFLTFSSFRCNITNKHRYGHMTRIRHGYTLFSARTCWRNVVLYIFTYILCVCHHNYMLHIRKHNLAMLNLLPNRSIF